MPHSRFFADQIDPEIILTPEEAFHLTKVMRKKSGELVELIDGHGTLLTCRIDRIEKEKVYFSEINRQTFAKPRKMILIQPLGEKMDWVVEKGTEIGVTDFFLTKSDLTQKELSTPSLSRLNRILISALKQSGSLYRPQIHLFSSIEEATAGLDHFYYGSLHHSSPAPLPKVPKERDPLALLVGAEGGFSQKESLFLLNCPRGTAIRPFEMTLRTETASIVLLALLFHERERSST